MNMTARIDLFIGKTQQFSKYLTTRRPHFNEFIDDYDDSEIPPIAEDLVIPKSNEINRALGDKDDRNYLASEIAQELSRTSLPEHNNLVPSLRKLVLFLDDLIRYSAEDNFEKLELSANEKPVLESAVNSVFEFLHEIKNASFNEDGFRQALEYLPFNSILNGAKQLGLDVVAKNPLPVEEIVIADQQRKAA